MSEAAWIIVVLVIALFRLMAHSKLEARGQKPDTQWHTRPIGSTSYVFRFVLYLSLFGLALGDLAS